MQKPEEKPASVKSAGKLGFFIQCISLVAFWGIVGVPMLAGISAFAGDGLRGQFLQVVALSAIVVGSFHVMNQMELFKWHSNEHRRTAYIWTCAAIWGSGLLLFWPG